jgi:hypothetical protein
VRVIDLSDPEEQRFKRCKAHKSCRMLIPSPEALAFFKELYREPLPVVLVVNRSALAPLVRPHGKDGPLRKWKPDAIVLDEVHEHKTPSANCSRAALMLAEHARYRLGLTGTPDPESHVDYYGIFKIICPGHLAKNKTEFDARYVRYNPVFPSKIEGYANLSELQAKIFAKSSIVKQADCFDMPKTRDLTIPVPLTRIARELYDELTMNAVADFYGVEVDATHQLSRLGILHQLCAGYLRNGDKVEWVFDGKIKQTLEEIESLLVADKRVVVFHHYRPEGERLVNEARKAFGVDRVGMLHGGVRMNNRSAAPFREWPNMRVFIAQEDTANLAISLREADHVLWTSWGPKSDVHFQARQRIFDDASVKPNGLTYGYMAVPNSADGFMLEVIRRKRSASELLLDAGFFNAAHGRV